LPNAAHYLFEVVLTNIDADNRTPFGAHNLRCRASYPTTGSGNERHFVTESHNHPMSNTKCGFRSATSGRCIPNLIRF
jgi:hypothetical protein